VSSGPVSSFSHAAVSTILNLPRGWSPEMIVCLGHPDRAQPATMRPGRRRTWRELTHWGRFED
jgi:nitroreductase